MGLGRHRVVFFNRRSYQTLNPCNAKQLWKRLIDFERGTSQLFIFYQDINNLTAKIYSFKNKSNIIIINDFILIPISKQNNLKHLKKKIEGEAAVCVMTSLPYVAHAHTLQLRAIVEFPACFPAEAMAEVKAFLFFGRKSSFLSLFIETPDSPRHYDAF